MGLTIHEMRMCNKTGSFSFIKKSMIQQYQQHNVHKIDESSLGFFAWFHTHEQRE